MEKFEEPGAKLRETTGRFRAVKEPCKNFYLNVHQLVRFGGLFDRLFGNYRRIATLALDMGTARANVITSLCVRASASP